MASKITEEERSAICLEAMRLLIDSNLVWSEDFEIIRPTLAQLFMKAITIPELSQHVTNLAVKVVVANG